jgi:hypothetical protein
MNVRIALGTCTAALFISTGSWAGGAAGAGVGGIAAPPGFASSTQAGGCRLPGGTNAAYPAGSDWYLRLELAQAQARVDALEADLQRTEPGLQLLGWEQARLHHELTFQQMADVDPVAAASLRNHIDAMERSFDRQKRKLDTESNAESSALARARQLRDEIERELNALPTLALRTR